MLFEAAIGFAGVAIAVVAEIPLGSQLAVTQPALLRGLAATLPMLAMLLGALGGPAAYFAGTKLGAMVFNEPWSMAAVSLQWLIAMPLLTWFARKQAGPEPLQLAAGGFGDDR